MYSMYIITQVTRSAYIAELIMGVADWCCWM